MKASSGPETEVALIAGEDRYNNFRIVPPPKTRLDPADMAAVAVDAERRDSVLYAGAKAARG